MHTKIQEEKLINRIRGHKHNYVLMKHSYVYKSKKVICSDCGELLSIAEAIARLTMLENIIYKNSIKADEELKKLRRKAD